MYVPPHFAESELSKLHDFIESHSFGVLISQGILGRAKK
jgi:transcriptional regulator